MQVIFQIFFVGIEILLLAISFSFIYNTSKFFHFAHAVIFTAGAYFSFLFSQMLGWSLIAAIPSAIIAACLFGCLIEWFVYNPLRKKGSSSIVLLLASLGIYIVLQNLILLFFGDDAKPIHIR